MEGGGGFNYSQIANFDARTYPHTFWIIFGTSKMFTKHGPLHPSLTTKTLQKLQENDKIFLKHIIFTYLDFHKNVKFGKDGHRNIPTNRENLGYDTNIYQKA